MANDILDLQKFNGLTIRDVGGLSQGSSEVFFRLIDKDGEICGFSFSNEEEYGNDVSVYLEDFYGNPNLSGAIFYEVIEKSGHGNSLTYTFYTIKTSFGYLDLRFAGRSNGYHSENCNVYVF